jgi:hypothetical protein
VVIDVLGGLKISCDGRPVLKNRSLMRRTVHALALTPDGLTEVELIKLTGKSPSKNDEHNLDQRLNDVAKQIGKGWCRRESDRLVLADHVVVDVRRFITLVEQGEADDAEQLLADGDAIALVDGVPRDIAAKFAPLTDRHAEALERHERQKAGPRLLTQKARGEIRAQIATAERLPVVPHLPAVKHAAEVADALAAAPLPWRDLSPPGELEDQPLLVDAILSHMLDGRDDDTPRRFFVCGGPGSGKSLVATVAYLRLAKLFNAELDAGRVSFVPLRFDVRQWMRRGTFGTDAWVRHHLRDQPQSGKTSGGLGIRLPLRPLLVLEHIDALLAPAANTPEKLDRLLRGPLFTGLDVIYSCQQPFFTRYLQPRAIEAQVAFLEPWPRELQLRYTEQVLGDTARKRLDAWLDEDPGRAEITKIPLQLVLVTTSLANDVELGGIKQSQHLFKVVANHRLARDAETDREAVDRRRVLGLVAHHFYEETRVDALNAIEFAGSRLTDLLEAQEEIGEGGVAKWVDILENHTMLVRDPMMNHFSFESASWGWYFVAAHIADVLERKPEETLQAFSKYLTKDITNFLIWNLRDFVGQAPRQARLAMQAALTAPPEEMTLDRHRVRIAREQIAYFLGSTRDPAVIDVLAPMLETEEDDWVRRGIAFGLADGDQPDYADWYVARLQAELEAGGEMPQRDTNIGFHLTFRGDQPVVVDRIDAISPDPSCVQTVAELVRGLSEDRHPGSWRIKLWTLIDLGRHPSIAPDAYAEAIAPHEAALREIARKLAAYGRARGWPELADLHDLLARFDEIEKRSSA